MAIGADLNVKVVQVGDRSKNSLKKTLPDFSKLPLNAKVVHKSNETNKISTKLVKNDISSASPSGFAKSPRIPACTPKEIIAP